MTRAPFFVVTDDAKPEEMRKTCFLFVVESQVLCRFCSFGRVCLVFAWNLVLIEATYWFLFPWKNQTRSCLEWFGACGFLKGRENLRCVLQAQALPSANTKTQGMVVRLWWRVCGSPHAQEGRLRPGEWRS